MTATWPDQPTVDADTAVAALEVHHARGRERTAEEQAVLEPWLGEGCCRAANYSDGFAHDHAVVTR